MVDAAFETMTVGAALNEATRRLRGAAVPAPRIDASVLLAAVLGVDRAGLWQRDDRMLSPGEARCFDDFLTQRLARRPVSQIVGEREFWSLSFVVSGDVLDPRPDSETVVEAVLAEIPDRTRPLRLLDLGTGSGCLLLALLSELPCAIGVGVDASPAALAIAARNARRFGLRDRCMLLAGDWASALDGPFDVVVSNPPYLRSAELAEVAPEVREHEPALALDGGPDGLVAYRALIGQLPRLLADSGVVFLECGADQATEVDSLLSDVRLSRVRRHRDLAGHDRCVTATAL